MFAFDIDEDITEGQNSCFRLDKITMRSERGQEVGYIKVTYIPHERFNWFTLLDLKGVRFSNSQRKQVMSLRGT